MDFAPAWGIFLRGFRFHSITIASARPENAKLSAILGAALLYIVIRYTYIMPIKLTTADYRALAELRYQIRQFVHEGDAAARQFGLEPQQYYLLLALRGIPEGIDATVRTLAE